MTFTTLGQFQVFDPLNEETGFDLIAPGEDGKHLVCDSLSTGGWKCDDIKANITGTFTFSSGTHAQISCSQIASSSVVSYSVISLGTVSMPQAILTTLEAGVGFTPVSADNTDTSIINWALVG